MRDSRIPRIADCTRAYAAFAASLFNRNAFEQKLNASLKQSNNRSWDGLNK